MDEPRALPGAPSSSPSIPQGVGAVDAAASQRGPGVPPPLAGGAAMDPSDSRARSVSVGVSTPAAYGLCSDSPTAPPPTVCFHIAADDDDDDEQRKSAEDAGPADRRGEASRPATAPWTGPAPTASRSSAASGLLRDSPPAAGTAAAAAAASAGLESHAVSIEMIESGPSRSDQQQQQHQQEQDLQDRESQQVCSSEAAVVSALLLDAARYLSSSPSPSPSTSPCGHSAVDGPASAAEEEQPLLPHRWVTLGDRLGMSDHEPARADDREDRHVTQGHGPMPASSSLPLSPPPPPPPTSGQPLAPVSLAATSFDASRLCLAVDHLTVAESKRLLHYMDVLMRDHIVRHMTQAQIHTRNRRRRKHAPDDTHGREDQDEEEGEDEDEDEDGEEDGEEKAPDPSPSPPTTAERRGTPAPVGACAGGERSNADESKVPPSRSPRAASSVPPLASFASAVPAPALPLPFHFPTLSNAHLVWRHLSLMRPDGVMLLQRVSGFVECGSMVCVLGASDAGATPLLRLLSQQQEGHTHGDILINGLHIDDSKATQAWRAVGFVSKDEIHLPTITVSEAMLFSAKLRLPATLPPLFVRLRVELVIRLLGLSRVRGSRIGDALIRGISGGERRRVSFACEMVSGAPIILADLPSNGLDSASAFSLLQSVKETNGRNRGLMCSLVQPSMELLRLFDTIVLLSKGSVIYRGPLDSMEAYFTAVGFPRPAGLAFPEYLESLSADARRCWDRRTPLIQACNLVGEAPTIRAWHHFDTQDIKPLAAWGAQAPNDEQTRNTNNKEQTRTATHGPSPSKELMSLNDAWSHLVLSFEQSEHSDRLHHTLSHRLAPLPVPRSKPLKASGPGAPVPPPSSFDLSLWRQLVLLLERQVWLTVRSREIIVTNLFRNVLMGFVLGSLWWQVGTGQEDARARFGLFFSAMNFLAMPAMALIPALVRQREVYYMQRAAHYYAPALHFLTLLLVNLPQAAMETLAMLVPLYPLAGLRGGVFSGPFWYAFLSLTLVNINARSWILFLTSVAGNEVIAQAVGPLTMVLMLNFAGYVKPRFSIPIGWRWFHYIDFMTYCFRGLVQNEMQSMTFHCTSESLAPSSSDPRLALTPPDGFGGRQTCLLQTGNDVLRLYDADTSDAREHWAMLSIQLLFFAVLSLLAGLAMTLMPSTGADPADAPRFRGKRMERRRRKHRLAMRHSHLDSVPTPVTLTWSHLTYAVELPRDNKAEAAALASGAPVPARTKTLLHQTFGYAKPTRMVALIGPSGAGKSTLLDVLANKKTGGQMSGSVCLNGRPRDKSFERFAGYVEQFDSQNPRSTVRECVELSARLRLPQSWSDRTIAHKVDNVLDVLGLRHVEHALVGGMGVVGVSPELRKKLTIAVELIMNPSLLFLDEPTTGLDSAGAIVVMEAVKRLAQHISVVCTIHQPSASIIAQFDLIMLLKAPGEVAYFGPLQQLSAYFSSHFSVTPCGPGANLADYALDTLATLEQRQVAAHKQGQVRPSDDIAFVFAQSQLAKQAWHEIQQTTAGEGPSSNQMDGGQDDSRPESASTALPPLSAISAGQAHDDGTVSDHLSHASFSTQVAYLIRRFVRNTVRNRAGLIARTSAPVFYALFLGTLYYQLSVSETDVFSRMPLMYIFTVESAYSCAIMFPAMFEARIVYFRELGAKTYTPAAYYWARLIADLPFSIGESILFTLLMYFAAGLTTADGGAALGLFVLGYWVNRMIGLAFAELCASVSPLAETANGVLAMSLNLLQLFAGFLIRAPSMPRAWMWMHYLCHFHYPIFLFQANEIRHIKHVQCSAGNRLPVSTPADAPVDCSNPATFDSSLWCSRPVCLISSGPDQLEAYSIDYSDSDLGAYLGAMMAFLLGYRIAAFIALKYVHHLKR